MAVTRLSPGGYPIAAKQPAAPGSISLQLAGFAAANVFGAIAFGASAITLTLSGFAEQAAFGAIEVAPGAVTVDLAGFAEANAFGALRLSLQLQITGFAAVNGFGALAVSPGAVTLPLVGFAEADRFGKTRPIPGPIALPLAGFADRDSFGAPLLQLKKKAGQGGGTKPGGVGAAQKYATRIVMGEAGLIVALEAQSSVARNVNTRMALYADQGGLPGALLAQSAVKTSVVTGANTYSLLVPRAAAAGTALWAALHSDGNFNWFLSAGPTSRFNADAFADGPSDPFGASTLQNNKAPVFLVFLEAAPINLNVKGGVEPNRFGLPGLPGPQTLALQGFYDRDAFGALALVPDQALQVAGFAEADRFGAPELRAASATIALSGFADGDGFGSVALTVDVARLTLSGMAALNRFGVLTLERTSTLVSDPALTLKSRHRRVSELSNPDGGLSLVSRHRRVSELSNPLGGLHRLVSRHKRRRTLENAES